MALQQLTKLVELFQPFSQRSERLSEQAAQLVDAVFPLRPLLVELGKMEARLDKWEEWVTLSEKTSAEDEQIAEELSEIIPQLGRVPQRDTYPDRYLDALGHTVEFVETIFPRMIEGSRGFVNQLSEAFEPIDDLFQSRVLRVAASKQLVQRGSAIRIRVKQLTERQQALAENYETHKDEWIADLLIQISRQRELTSAEKLRLSDAVELALPVQTMPSVRRQDWYGDDGR